MPFEQYHEPADELPEETRTFARICLSLIEEAEAIDWYEQRLALEKDPEARAIMKNALLIGSTSVKRRVTASDFISPFFSGRV